MAWSIKPSVHRTTSDIHSANPFAENHSIFGVLTSICTAVPVDATLGFDFMFESLGFVGPSVHVLHGFSSKWAETLFLSSCFIKEQHYVFAEP